MGTFATDRHLISDGVLHADRANAPIVAQIGGYAVARLENRSSDMITDYPYRISTSAS